jgi:HlyD family secretion protein
MKTRRFSRLGPVLAAAAVALVLGAFLPLASSLGGGARGEVAVYRVERRPFERRVPAQGSLQAVRATPVSVPLGAPGPFRIAWLAPDGSRVKTGEVVVRFDPSEIEKRLRDAEADLATARLKAEKQRIEDGAELSKLEREAAVARLELKDARQFQKKDDLVFSHHEIIESEIDGTLAAARERHAEAARGRRRALGGTEMALLAIDLRRAETKIHQAREALTALAVTAPHDGVLVLTRDYRGNPPRVGDSVWNGQPLAQIPDLSAMQAQVFVLEADAGGLAAGKPATVAVESAPGVAWPARILRVDALAKPRVRGSPVQYFAVTLALARTDPKVMKPGQRVQAELLLDRLPQALAVPRQAVFERGGKTFVYRRGASGAFEPVDVAVGPSGMGRVVIDRGLAAGDRVALADPTRPRERRPPPGGAAGGSSGTAPVPAGAAAAP